MSGPINNHNVIQLFDGNYLGVDMIWLLHNEQILKSDNTHDNHIQEIYDRLSYDYQVKLYHRINDIENNIFNRLKSHVWYFDLCDISDHTLWFGRKVDDEKILLLQDHGKFGINCIQDNDNIDKLLHQMLHEQNKYLRDNYPRYI